MGEERLASFYNDNLEMLALLEEAYIALRYIAEDIAERALAFAHKALGVFEWLEKL